MTADINGADGKEGQLEQIYKQRWFADFLDGMSAWRMERRTRALNLPPLFLNGSQAYEEGGNMYYGWPAFTSRMRNVRQMQRLITELSICYRRIVRSLMPPVGETISSRCFSSQNLYLIRKR